MPPEPSLKRAVTFLDGQNLFHSARESFGYTYPNYDVQALSRKICEPMGWTLNQVRFYTGVPDPSDDAGWNSFWVRKLRAMSWQNVHVYSRSTGPPTMLAWTGATTDSSSLPEEACREPAAAAH